MSESLSEPVKPKAPRNVTCYKRKLLRGFGEKMKKKDQEGFLVLWWELWWVVLWWDTEMPVDPSDWFLAIRHQSGCYLLGGWLTRRVKIKFNMFHVHFLIAIMCVSYKPSTGDPFWNSSGILHWNSRIGIQLNGDRHRISPPMATSQHGFSSDWQCEFASIDARISEKSFGHLKTWKCTPLKILQSVWKKLLWSQRCVKKLGNNACHWPKTFRNLDEF